MIDQETSCNVFMTNDDQLTPAIVNTAKKTGQLNLSSKNLSAVPKSMFTMYHTGNTNDDGEYVSEPQEWDGYEPLRYLDLSSNFLPYLPSQISMFEDLVVINIQNNCLEYLPPQIGKLSRLTKLNAGRNQIQSLPEEFYLLTELTFLNLSKNLFNTISNKVGCLTMLQNLDLSFNKLRHLPPEIGCLVRLIDLNLSQNLLLELPAEISKLSSLQTLDISNNQLRCLPKLGPLSKLESLFATYNKLDELPDFKGCERLQELYLGYNNLTDIPEVFCTSFMNLKVLQLRENKLSCLPDEIDCFQRLTRLDLTDNMLETLPYSMGSMRQLQNLQLEGNPMTNFKLSILKGGTTKILNYLRDCLDSQQVNHVINEVDEELEEPGIYPTFQALKQCSSLNLSMKGLHTIPDRVFRNCLKANVRIVELYRNKLSDVPSGLTTLAPIITDLNVSKNRLRSIPDFICTFQYLNILNIAGNELSALPENLSNLENLKEIVMSNNLFRKIPDCVYSVRSLEVLMACDNQITNINVEGLKKLPRLMKLGLANNNIEYVPPELGLFKQLTLLELKGNNFRLPRYAILDLGTERVLSYLRDRIPQY